MEQLNRVWVRIKPHLIWTMSALIVLLYFVAWAIYYFSDLQWLSGILSQAATAILVSGVFASLLKSYQFSELFKEELSTFFTEPSMIKKMREIAVFGKSGDNIVHKAMEHALTANYPELCPKFNESSLKLLRLQHEYYLRNFTREISLIAYDADTGVIKIRDEVNSDLVVTASTDYVSNHSGFGMENNQTKVVKLDLTTNAEAPVCMMKHVKNIGEHLEVRFPIKAGTNYRFCRVLDQEYSLRRDPVLQQQFSRFGDGMILRIFNHVPEKLEFNVRFLNFAEQIEPVILDGNDKTSFKKTYTIGHLTFPYQGFIVTIFPT